MVKFSKQSVYRILDANINRATEGIRVCEEVARFILNDRSLTSGFKNMRHQISKIFGGLEKGRLINKRDIRRDVGQSLLCGELKRKDCQDIFFANMQRTKESLRVLEEFYKLIDIKGAIKLKRIRYNAYEAEKKIALRLSSLSTAR